ncbi:MAG: hypothetical protein MUD01_05275 [Chloroflexaceae bacterium]|jgi:hypothetical protein|nr:hypothetical protein [Chloroflexaceae bacterium]
MSLIRDPKRLLALLVASVAGLIVLLDFTGAFPQLAPAAEQLVSWAATLTALALLVGLVSVAIANISRVVRRDTDWLYSLVLLLGMLLVILVGIVGIPGISVLPQNLAEEPIRVFFRLVYEPLAASLLALLAFFSLSAALRAFQRRNVEAMMMVVIALLVLVTQLPPVLSLPYVGETIAWINAYLVTAGARGLLIGVAIGTLVASIRVLLGLDQPYLDR